MTKDKIRQILEDTAYIRTGGSAEELRCAQYIQNVCKEMGMDAYLEEFEVDMADMKKAVLTVDGEEIPCTGYLCAGSGVVEAPLYYMPNDDKYSLSQCKGKIVMTDAYLRHWMYQDMLEAGAVGFITYSGDANYADEEIDTRELRQAVSLGKKILGVNINAKQAIRLVENDCKMARIELEQDEYKGKSHNVIVDLPGEVEETIVFTAHYDSTALSQGVYDNMSGSVGILGIAEYFTTHPHKYSLRFVWCGSEERGLLGSKAYVANHEDILDKIVFNINLDMIGSTMGRFIAVCTTEDKLVSYLKYYGDIEGFPMAVRQEVYSSDSTPFADKGVPALSFARIAPHNTATIHNSHDTIAVMKMEHMEKDIAFITKFSDVMANAVRLPVDRKIPDNMKEKLDIYLLRKRDER
ncbi:MAG: Zn-dependent exopeptidase M28 [Agathobacter sp.]|nr:Zn-dependent exopeptidase M28 [Agathobacter sp.]